MIFAGIVDPKKITILREDHAPGVQHVLQLLYIRSVLEASFGCRCHVHTAQAKPSRD
ncbi:MAG TPA: hypothetical protein VFW73_06320 [Lacipirellulaceae bacterium]|nr:hypothetical protein [Lacipirellulaceae bacterium]